MLNMKGVKHGQMGKLICVSTPDEYELPLLFTRSCDEVSRFTGVKKKSIAEQLSRQRKNHTQVICIGGYHVEQL